MAAGERFDLVFSIAEGVRGRSREAQVPALCELFDQPYLFSDPLTMSASLDKAVAKRLVADAGVPTPSFAVAASDAGELRDGTTFPPSSSRLPRARARAARPRRWCDTKSELAAAVAKLLARYRQPVLVETYLPGREFTVGIVGNGEAARVVGVCEILLNPQAEANIYSLHNKELCEELVTYTRADDAEAQAAGERALVAYHALECRDAARIDFRSDAHGEPYFLEANPLGGAASPPFGLADSRRPERHWLRRTDRHDPRRWPRALWAGPPGAGAAAENRVMALKPHGFIPVVHAATEERPDEIDTLIAAEAVALALAELGFFTDIVAVGLDASEIEALKGAQSLARVQSRRCGEG